MDSTNTSNEIRYLASAITLASGYYAIRTSLQLPKFHEMFVGMDAEQPQTLNTMILNYPYGYLAVVVMTLLVTLAIIWTNLKFRHRIYPIGICLLVLFTERAVTAAFDPLFRMVSTMNTR